MRNVELFLAGFIILFATIGCEKDEVVEDALYMKASLKKSVEMKTVPFKGNFISSPSAQVPIFCTGDNDPATGEPLVAAKINKVEGNATHLGILDDMNSPLIAEACNLNLQAGILSVTLNITFKNKKGDGIRILGVSNISLAGLLQAVMMWSKDLVNSKVQQVLSPQQVSSIQKQGWQNFVQKVV
jgi:hypothetical protein